MTTSAGEQIRPYHSEAAAAFPILPATCIIDQDVEPGASLGQTHMNGLNAFGVPRYECQKGYTVSRHRGLHEAGHAFVAELYYYVPVPLVGPDWRERAWKYLGYANTYAQQLADANAQTSPSAQWNALPEERIVEAFASCLDGVPLQGVPSPAALREFFAAMMYEARPSTRPIAPAPPPAVTPPPPSPQPTTPFALAIIDVREQLPRADWEFGRARKSSITVHWNGPPIPAGVDPLEVIVGDANFHISKDWSPAPGVQGGDGIMYHFLIAPDGRVFKTRDDDAVLWHCNSEIGNFYSYAVQVMVGGDGAGVGDPVTAAQFLALRELIALLALNDVKPHRAWSGTACPGLEITNWVLAHSWEKEEDDMFTEDDRRKLTRVYDHLEAYEPMTWLARLQQWLAKAFRSMPVTANADLSGPDVKTGEPFK